MVRLVVVTKRDEIERSLQQGCSVQGQELEHDYHNVVFSCPLKLDKRERQVTSISYPSPAIRQPNAS